MPDHLHAQMHTWKLMCWIHIYTMCARMYHVCTCVPCVHMCTMCAHVYHVCTCVLCVHICTMCAHMYHVCTYVTCNSSLWYRCTPCSLLHHACTSNHTNVSLLALTLLYITQKLLLKWTHQSYSTTCDTMTVYLYHHCTYDEFAAGVCVTVCVWYSELKKLWHYKTMYRYIHEREIYLHGYLYVNFTKIECHYKTMPSLN